MGQERINSAGAEPATIADTLLFCSGSGQSDTHALTIKDRETGKDKPNPHPSAGTDYEGVTPKAIVASVKAPPSLPKEQARWFIPSTYRGSDARAHQAQREHGEFWFLPLDVDCNNLDLGDIDAALVAVCGPVARMIYSTRSSTAENRKWRALVPLQRPLAGADYGDTVEAFNGLLAEASGGVLIADEALRRPGQLVYLPNRGEFYEHATARGNRLDLDGHRIVQRREDTRRKRLEAEKAAGERQRKRASVQVDAGGERIVDLFNRAHTVAELLEKYGYTRAGRSNDWKSPFQTSGSFATRDYGDFWISLSASDDREGLGQATKDGARIGDAFDLFKHFEHHGEERAAVRAYAQETGQDHKGKRERERAERRQAEPKAVDPAPISRAAKTIGRQIAKRLREAVPDLPADPEVDLPVIQGMIDGAFWSGAKSRMFILSEVEALLQFTRADCWRHLKRRFGTPVDEDAVFALAPTPQNDKAAAGLRKAIAAAVVDPILDHIMYHNQADEVAWRVDMFGKAPAMEVQDGEARITLTHRPIPETHKINSECLSDYMEHFPLLDRVLDFIAAARFAADRKKAYLWMLAQSDWGKGYFMTALRDLGVVVEMSVKEIEAAFEGKPAAKSPKDFLRALVLAVDEFKTVKAELKQLGSEIYLAPKFQLQARVEVFTKLFLSAESVGSLVGEHGVEDQFCRRMSVLTGSGVLDTRPVFMRDKTMYANTVRGYIAKALNKRIAAYQAMGRDAAANEADKVLTAFQQEHGIGNHFSNLSESYPEIAASFLDWLKRFGSDRVTTSTARPGVVFLKNASKVLEDFLTASYTQAEAKTLARRKGEILIALSSDGKGSWVHKFGKESIRGVRLAWT